MVEETWRLRKGRKGKGCRNNNGWLLRVLRLVGECVRGIAVVVKWRCVCVVWGDGREQSFGKPEGVMHDKGGLVVTGKNI